MRDLIDTGKASETESARNKLVTLHQRDFQPLVRGQNSPGENRLSRIDPVPTLLLHTPKAETTQEHQHTEVGIFSPKGAKANGDLSRPLSHNKLLRLWKILIIVHRRRPSQLSHCTQEPMAIKSLPEKL